MQTTRELEEETSIKNVKLIKELDGFQTYLLPQKSFRNYMERKIQGSNTKVVLYEISG